MVLVKALMYAAGLTTEIKMQIEASPGLRQEVKEIDGGRRSNVTIVKRLATPKGSRL